MKINAITVKEIQEYNTAKLFIAQIAFFKVVNVMKKFNPIS